MLDLIFHDNKPWSCQVLDIWHMHSAHDLSHQQVHMHQSYCFLHTYIKYGGSGRLRAKLRLLASMGILAWAFFIGICAYWINSWISIKILCHNPYILLKTVQIRISWLLQKPDDLDQHSFWLTFAHIAC